MIYPAGTHEPLLAIPFSADFSVQLFRTACCSCQCQESREVGICLAHQQAELQLSTKENSSINIISTLRISIDRMTWKRTMLAQRSLLFTLSKAIIIFNNHY